MSSSSSDEEPPPREPNPEKIRFELLKSGGSNEHGVLLTHDLRFKFHKCGYNRRGDTYWYVCSARFQGCRARAGEWN